MNSKSQLEARVQKWIGAGIIDAQTGQRIVSFEASQEHGESLHWPVILAMIFGGILLAAGVTLFVAAHWSELSPTARFVLLLAMMCVFHVIGAFVVERFPIFSTTMHAVGTATLGASIFLTAQIFNLQENWATGVLLWAVGAAIGYILLRDRVHAAYLALLTPAWLIGQWYISTDHLSGSGRPLAIGLILTPICYLSARIGDESSGSRRTLVWIGGLALLPSVGFGMACAGDWRFSHPQTSIGYGVMYIGLLVAILAPLFLAWFFRGPRVWINILWAIWAYALAISASNVSSYAPDEFHYRTQSHIGPKITLYILCALGSAGLVIWGLREKRRERINLGVAAFAVSVLFFYFDGFMGKLGRSASLLILGLLCLGGGYALEITRRKLVRRLAVSS